MDTLPAVVNVFAQDDYSLLITFDNGESSRFDMRPYLDRGVFVRLKNLGVFKLARVAYGTVAWPGELDIAPETLYLKSVAVTGQTTAA